MRTPFEIADRLMRDGVEYDNGRDYEIIHGFTYQELRALLIEAVVQGRGNS